MNIVFLDHLTLNSDGLSLDALNAIGNTSFYERTFQEDVISRCENAQVVITNKVKITEDHLRALPMLNLIVVAATGYNNIDIHTCVARGVTVCNVRGYSTEAVVQHTFSLILSLRNRVEYYHNQVKKGRWLQSGDFSFYDHSISELNGQTMGIVGYGNIGKRVADVAAIFGMKVIVYTRSPQKVMKHLHRLVELEELFRRSDVISLHLPLNNDSDGIISSASLGLMKSTAILINTSRGGLVIEDDLAEALKSGKITGAGIDTLPEEPPESSPLFGLDNCLVTPHMAWATVQSRQALLDGIIQNIKAFQSGKPINVIC